MRYVPHAVVCATGFITLSYELLWVRAYSFLTGASSASFGILLGAYLAGIAVGSLAVRKLCSTQVGAGAPRHLRYVAILLFAANLLAFAVVPVTAWLVTFRGWRLMLVLVGLSAGAFGATLPLITHFASPPDDRAGSRVAALFAWNIAGSVTGTFITGFVLLDLLTFQQIALGLVTAGTAVSTLLILGTGLRRSIALATVATGAALVCGCVFASPRVHAALYERLLWKNAYVEGETFERVLENRHGVVAIDTKGTVWGGGTYDGLVTVDLVRDENRLVRPLAVGAFHPAPKRVLMIGLAMGPWAQVVVNMPGVEHLEIVEINPAYLELIPEYPDVASLLDNPRVAIHVDDGRRWLLRHPDEKFDVIVQNTTQHHRAHITNLVSREYQEIARAHLKPGGMFLINTTRSEDIMKTSLAVFAHGVRIDTCMLVSDAPLRFDRDRWERVMRGIEIDGAPAFDPDDPLHEKRIRELLAKGDDLTSSAASAFESKESLLARIGSARVITDDNMLSEWAKLRW